MSLEIYEHPICETDGHAWVKISVDGKPGRPQWVGIDGSADSIVVDNKYEMKPTDWNSDDFHYTARQIDSKSDSDASIEVSFYKQSENVVETDIDTINSIAMVHFYYHLCYELCAAHCLKDSNWMNVINCFEKVKPAGMDPNQFEKIIDTVKTMMIDDDLASDDENEPDDVIDASATQNTEVDADVPEVELEQSKFSFVDIENWFSSIKEGGLSVSVLRKKATDFGFEGVDSKTKKSDIRKIFVSHVQSVQAKGGNIVNADPVSNYPGSVATSVTATTSAPTSIPDVPSASQIATWFGKVKEGGFGIKLLRERATHYGIEYPAKCTRTELERIFNEKFVKTSANNGSDSTLQVNESFTMENLQKWSKPPQSGGRNKQWLKQKVAENCNCTMGSLSEKSRPELLQMLTIAIMKKNGDDFFDDADDAASDTSTDSKKLPVTIRLHPKLNKYYVFDSKWKLVVRSVEDRTIVGRIEKEQFVQDIADVHRAEADLYGLKIDPTILVKYVVCKQQLNASDFDGQPKMGSVKFGKLDGGVSTIKWNNDIAQETVTWTKDGLTFESTGPDTVFTATKDDFSLKTQKFYYANGDNVVKIMKRRGHKLLTDIKQPDTANKK